MRLTIELVPETSWGKNLRSEFTKNQWDIIRKFVYKRAGYICEICGGVGKNHPVEAHEEWIYHDNGIQELHRIVALCPACHLCKHPGFANVHGRMEEVILHLMKINRIPRECAID